MEFLKKFTKTNKFQEVVRKINNQLKDLPKERKQQAEQKNSKIKQDLTIKSQNDGISQTSEIYTYEQAEDFIVQLNKNSKNYRRQQMQKKTKKQVFANLQTQPIYLQTCDFTSLLKMQIQLGQMGGYERTQVLHNYLNQVDGTINKIIFTQNMQILQSIPIALNFQLRISAISVKLKSLRGSIQNLTTNKADRIKKMMLKKLVMKQKLSLLQNMRQKQQISLIKPQNIEQVYYSERSRHKLYLKIKNTKTINSYFNSLRNQIVRISQNNLRIITSNFKNWINQGQGIQQKSIQKLFICLFFVKNQLIYKENGLDISLEQLNKDKFVQEIEKVKIWKDYQYIRDPTMKSKIFDFLNNIIREIQDQT